MRSKDSFLGYRALGVLMPISALPSNSACGTFGQGARDFVDALSEAGVSFWQILPLNIQGKANSPYSSPSAFAISSIYLDRNDLAKEGLCAPNDANFEESDRTDYSAARLSARCLCDEAFGNFEPTENFEFFCRDNAFWLDDFAHYFGRLESQKRKVEQYLLRQQWQALKEYANKKGIKIIGDIPFYISPEAVDVLTHKSLFAVGEDYTPLFVAGVPPDRFSKTGQLWGNPIYNWRVHKAEDYAWWHSRIAYALSLFDYLRIDHFRAFSSFYSVPFGAKDARTGAWESAPGRDFFGGLEKELASRIIAEDLGEPTPDVAELLDFTGFPGMQIVQFAFDKRDKTQLLPSFHERNCVCYTGTHDNSTARGWFEFASEKELKYFESVVPDFDGAAPDERLIKFGATSNADLYIIQAQDALRLSDEARFNVPSTISNNWVWRMTTAELKKLPNCIKELLEFSGRLNL